MRTYGLIGYPLGHSFSRRFFTEKFQAENKPEQYLNFEIPAISRLAEVVDSLSELAGLNVTIPYKEQVMPFLHKLDSISEAIGAVNTIRISGPQGSRFLEGFNTDVAGFTGSLQPLLTSWHRKALVLGTGGASKAVTFSLERLGIEWIRVSRKPEGNAMISYGEITPDLLDSHTLIINTTPLGTFPNVNDCVDIPYEALTNRHLLFDLVYNPAETKFLSLGRSKGASIRNGYKMLEIQALESYRIWNEGRPE